MPVLMRTNHLIDNNHKIYFNSTDRHNKWQRIPVLTVSLAANTIRIKNNYPKKLEKEIILSFLLFNELFLKSLKILTFRFVSRLKGN